MAPHRMQLILLMCLMVFAIYASYALWESVISVHMTNLGIPFRNYSLLWTLNGFMIVIGQPFVNRLFVNLKLPVQIGIGVFIFATSFFLLVFTSQYYMFIIVMVVLTIGEMIGFPGMPAWIDALAVNGRKGKYQACTTLPFPWGGLLDRYLAAS